ncbi:MAG TPA: head GIN domain-containing protein [Bacteroidia bacterium]|jgi:hypothetical protein|nr:head GIN domain-containing protein [Bacteroidia bacterium]
MSYTRKYINKLSAISYWLIAISLLSCNKTPVCDCFESAGSEASDVRVLPYFNQIIANDNVNVFITTGSPQSVTIEGGKNLIPNIGANVNGTVLTLKNNNICNWLRSYKKSHINVYITMPELTTITNSGYGTVQSQGTLTFDSLVLNTTNSAGNIDLAVNNRFINAHMFGTADLTLSGNCQTFLCNYFGGTGFIYNGNLVVSSYAFLSSNTTGDSYLNTTGTLGVQIYGQGNVYYTGNPTSVQSSSIGSGQLIKQ